MAYKLKQNKKIKKQLKKRLIEQIDSALEGLQDASLDFDEKVHKTRKHFKKIRGLLRLGIGFTGKKFYSKENKRYREFAHRLGNARETVVNYKTFKGLQEGFESTQTEKISGILKEKHEQTRDKLIKNDDLVKLANDLKSIREKYQGLTFKSKGPQAFSHGLERVYRRGRKALNKAELKPIPENFHELRKRVKYLWYHMRLLKNSNKLINGAYANLLDKLSDKLGDKHDLSELEQCLHENIQTTLPTEMKKKLDENREKLRKESLAHSKGIFAEPTGMFVKRQLHYWNQKP